MSESTDPPRRPDEHPVEHGDRRTAIDNEILRSLVGSTVHGVDIPGRSDRDEMGIYIEPPEVVLSPLPGRGDYVRRSQPEGGQSGSDDTDLIMYGLRKYLRLAIDGNPTVLLPLFAAESQVVMITGIGHELRALREAFLSRQAVERFLGYMASQRGRLLDTDRRMSSAQPSPERRAKYASHALRLAYQGREICRSATLTLPLPAEQRERVLAVKLGEVPQPEVIAEVDEVERQIRDDLDAGRSPLPQRPDLARILSWNVDATRRHWGWVAAT